MNDLIKMDIVIAIECNACWSIFIDRLKLEFDSFAMYIPSTKEFFFRSDTQTTVLDVQTFVDSFLCSEAQIKLDSLSSDNAFMQVQRSVDPTIFENIGKNVIWLNTTTGEIFTCIDSTTDRNMWRGTSPGKLIQPIPPANKFDFFSDGSALCFLELNGDTLDAGGEYNGSPSKVIFTDDIQGECLFSNKRGCVEFDSMQITQPAITISTWVKWSGNNWVMPFGFESSSIATYKGYLGFNSSNSDIYGVPFTAYEDKWVYLTVVFKEGQYGDIYLDGVKQTLSQVSSEAVPELITLKDLRIFGFGYSSRYRDFGWIKRFRVFSTELTQSQIELITVAETNLMDALQGKNI